MVKRIAKRIRLNFKQTHSERAAERSYRNYHKAAIKFLKEKARFFRKKK